jgi:ribosomal protein L11 methyltransferase
MKFIKTNIYTKSGACDSLIFRLEDLDIGGFEAHDPVDFQEFLDNKDANWDYVEDSLMALKDEPTYVTVYLQDNAQGIEMLGALLQRLGEIKKEDNEDYFGSLHVETESVEEEDWADNWKQYFKPFPVGEKLMIKPTWETVNDDTRKILEIDPASSFGTGQHETTFLCLEALEKNIQEGDTVLDLGCGSGILAVAALLLGAKHVTITDIFENAVDTSCENIENNGFDSNAYRAFCGDITKSKKLRDRIGSGYRVITANIVADVIIAMSPYFKNFLDKNGVLLVSGIISERLKEVISSLQEHSIIIKSVTEKNGWNLITCTV